MFTMLILCSYDVLNQLVQDLAGKEVTILLSGQTTKVKQGFIFLGWPREIAARLHEQLRQDARVIDFFAFGGQV
jgi:hypothetical protein